MNLDNRGTFEERQQPGAHDFGYSSATNHAEGTAGEAGGIFWRTDSSWAQYADRIESVSLKQGLEASGKLMLVGASPESAVYLGWFNSETDGAPPVQAGNFIGVRIEGAAGGGHRFTPGYATATGKVGKAEKAPLMALGAGCLWSISYDPTARKGAGEIRVTLGEESVVLPLEAGHRAAGGSFDRFGLFTGYPRGQALEFYLDDLSYSVGGTH
jgi:hypothetical protein